MSAGCTFPQRKEITARLQIREVHIAETEIEIYERRLQFSATERDHGKTADYVEYTNCRDRDSIYERRLHFSATERSRQDCRYVKYTLQ